MTHVAACMTSDELRLWHEANDVSRWTGSPASSPCVDCPLWFAQEMRRQGCCNGEPAANRPARPRKVASFPATERRRAQWRAAKQRQRVA